MVTTKKKRARAVTRAEFEGMQSDVGEMAAEVERLGGETLDADARITWLENHMESVLTRVSSLERTPAPADKGTECPRVGDVIQTESEAAALPVWSQVREDGAADDDLFTKTSADDWRSAIGTIRWYPLAHRLHDRDMRGCTVTRVGPAVEAPPPAAPPETEKPSAEKRAGPWSNHTWKGLVCGDSFRYAGCEPVCIVGQVGGASSPWRAWVDGGPVGGKHQDYATEAEAQQACDQVLRSRGWTLDEPPAPAAPPPAPLPWATPQPMEKAPFEGVPVLVWNSISREWAPSAYHRRSDTHVLPPPPPPGDPAWEEARLERAVVDAAMDWWPRDPDCDDALLATTEALRAHRAKKEK